VKELIDWLLELGVGRVAMESTAQYWKPVWYALEPFFSAFWRSLVPRLHREGGRWISLMPNELPGGY
jgi:hypothetical protein